MLHIKTLKNDFTAVYFNINVMWDCTGVWFMVQLVNVVYRGITKYMTCGTAYMSVHYKPDLQGSILKGTYRFSSEAPLSGVTQKTLTKKQRQKREQNCLRFFRSFTKMIRFLENTHSLPTISLWSKWTLCSRSARFTLEYRNTLKN